MRRHCITLTDLLWKEVTAALADDHERAGIIVGSLIDDPDGATFVASELVWAADDDYRHRGRDQLVLSSDGWAPMARSASKAGRVAAFVHTHPGGGAKFSTRDLVADLAIAEAYGSLCRADLVSVVVAGSPTDPAIVARRVTADGARTDFDVVRVVGDRLRVWPLGEGTYDSLLHDRQVRALGPEGQRILGAIKVGLVGLGGTGSPIYDMLHRIGVRDIVAIDDDIVTDATPSRGVHYSPQHEGIPKVAVMEDLTDHLAMDARVELVRGDITTETVARKLRHCDLVFSCTDGHAGRIPVNRIPYWVLAPVIDVAVRVDSMPGQGEADVVGRVTWVSPGAACLVCRGRVDPAIAYAEQLNPEERRAMAGEGYVPGLAGPAPAVVAYTSMMAGHAIDELLRRLLGFGGHGRETETVFQISRRAVRRNRQEPKQGCFCGNPEVWAQGDSEPWLGQLWIA